MIRILMVALFFLYQITDSTTASLASVDTTSDKECFLRGNAYFLQGKFNKARDCYEKIVQKSSAVWHNLGNSYFNEKNNIKALLCWKRAQRNATFSQLGQLFEAEHIVLNQMNCPGDGILMRNVKCILLGISQTVMQGFLLLFLFIFLVIWYQCMIQAKNLYRFTACKRKYLAWLLFGSIIMLIMIAAKEKLIREKQAVVTQKDVAVYVGPAITYSQKIMLPLGCVVRVIDEKQNMIKVLSSLGYGWVQSNNVEIV